MGSLSTLVPPHRNIVFSLLFWLILLWPSVVSAQTKATDAPLLLPSAVAFDASGSFYIAETGKHLIRRVDASGGIITVAGTGVQGYDGDGSLATSALLDSPQGIAVTSTSLYIADTHNHRIRKVDLKSGIITTTAGGTTAGATGDNGPASAATLDRPMALAVNNKGDLFIADSGAHRVRRIDAGTGVITTVAGIGVQGYDGDQGDASAALLDSPQGLAVDGSGNLYLSDTHNQRVRRIDAKTGVISTVSGTGAFGFAGDSGASTHAELALPRGLAVDLQGNVYLADSANHRVRRIDAATGTITTLAGDGVQNFAGDGGAPDAASLDSPNSVALSQSGLVTLADTKNQRVRQVSDETIQTVAGLASTRPVSIAIAGAGEIPYGSGELTATISSENEVAGTVTFFDRSESPPGVVAKVPISQNAAVLDLSGIAAGKHLLTAAYGGDSSHGSAQSIDFELTVTPRPLTAIISPASLSYGEQIPALAGSLSGLLPRDQTEVSGSYRADLPIRPDVGTYPITIELSGAAAGNYQVISTPVLTITKAATITTLTATTASLVSATNADAGQPILLRAHVASTTSGNPGGTVILSDGATLLSAGSPDSSGDFSFATSALSAGPHSLTAIYSGDGNFRSSTSPTALFIVNTPPTGPQDFTLAPGSATTQTIVAGDSANFFFVVNAQGVLPGPVTLSASGLPDLATASFNPGTVVPGVPSARVTMTIATPRTSSLLWTGRAVAVALLLPLLSLAGSVRRISAARLLMIAGLVTLSLSFSGCGDRVRTGTAVPDGTKTYNITINATTAGTDGTSLQHSTSVTLIVQPAT
ncbi:Ig-like domain repeat protein [Edaphobacter sp. HDX4]|uniref:Ig-like domain repeat protein n=1 Tax=Edaphobacter sp. HDX4 TaxID=2794064 RepID=UPI002FE62A99